VTPNDPFFGTDPSNSIDLDPTQWGLRKVRAPQAWQEKQATGFGIKVAVIDSGVDLEHEDLQCAGKIESVPGSNYIDATKSPDDDNGHGTHVAGIIGACTNNNKGVAGVAPDTTIVPFKVLDAAGDGNLNNAAAAVRKATDSGADVINMSLGSILGPASGIRQPVKALTFMDEAVAYAQSKGVVVVAAAGNDSGPLCEYPSAIEGVLCVGATDPRDLKSWYSVFPNKIDGAALGPAVVAPGGTGQVFCDLVAEDILSTYATDVDEAAGDCDGRLGYTALNGTSMASPHVAGVAALVYDRLGGVRTAQNAQTVIDAIVDSADDLGAPGYDPAFGFGRVNALAAVRAIPVQAEEVTALEITQSPEAAQHSDDALFEARLTDSAGNALAGKELSFELTGESGTQTETTTTGADGLASETFTLTGKPGAYQLTVRYAGENGVFKGAADVAPFVVEKEDAVAELVVSGYGSNRKLDVRLTDGDTPDSGLSDKTVELLADGQSIGTTTTGSDGRASVSAPAPYHKGAHAFEATFGGDDFFTTATETATTGEGATTLTLTPASATSGQYSDTSSVEALLIDEGNDPVVGDVTFELSGPGGSRTWTVLTGADGIASKVIDVDLAAGDYTLAARFAGQTGQFTSSSDQAAFQIVKEDTALSLAIQGTGNNKVARARLVDGDSDIGIAGRTITFTADGKSIGSAVTDSSGVATLNVPKGAKKPSGKNEYVASFGGDDFYKSSSRTSQQ
jgi:hypothetical protein